MGAVANREEYKVRTNNLVTIFLRDKADETEVPLMMDATRDLMEGISYIDLDIKGTSIAEKVLYGVFLADYISYYVAILKGNNPSSTNVADEFLEKMASYDQIEEINT